jgi:hypothetical protein
MKEVCRCSNQTVQLVALRLRRAATKLSIVTAFRDRLEMIAYQAAQQGLQPNDFASAAGEDALIAIATALPSRARFITVDTESHPKTIVVDSLSHAYKTAKANDFRVLYSPQPQAQRMYPTRIADERGLSTSWQRVLKCALDTPR